MNLHQAAKYFDRDSVYDGYTGDFLFKAQFTSYDGSQADGSFLRRRTISIAPGIVMPDRRVGLVHGERWVLGTPIVDGWMDSPIRGTASSKLATDLFTIQTPGKLLGGAAGARTAYAHTRPLKDTVNTTTDSEYDAQYEVTFGVNELGLGGHFLVSDRLMLHVRAVELPPEGFIEVIADDLNSELDAWGNQSGIVDVQLSAGSYDPITELETPGATVKGVLMDMYKLYQYNEQADSTNTRGDLTLLLQNTVNITTGSEITIGNVKYRVITKQPYLDAWNLHIRKA